jgi:hypothetical protein
VDAEGDLAVFILLLLSVPSCYEKKVTFLFFYIYKACVAGVFLDVVGLVLSDILDFVVVPFMPIVYLSLCDSIC